MTDLRPITMQSIAALRDDPQGRVHGNGFIQVDLDDLRRLHIFGDSRIPHQTVNTEIHDHRFGFTSTILAGALTNHVMKLTQGRNYDLYEARARKGEDTKLVRMDGPFGVETLLSRTYTLGRSYHMPPREFHRTETRGFTITVIEKTSEANHRPRVLCTRGQVPDNDFNRYDDAHRAACGAVIERALNSLYDLVGAFT